MADFYYGEITIGGKVSRKVWEVLKQAISRDTGIRLDKPPKMDPQPDYLVFDSPDLPYGMFNKIEEACVTNGVPYRRKSLGEDPELLVFNPTNLENPSHSYSINVESNIMTQAAELMELRDAMKEVTLQNAPMFVNDKRLLYEKYAKCLLAGIDFQTMMIAILDDYLPPSIPELPPFRVGE